MYTTVAFVRHGALLPVLVLLLVIIFIFEIAMFVSAIRNKNISTTAKLLWLLGMLLIHPIVAIVYYFTDHKKLHNH